jgi:hypothetical protein
MGGTPTTDRVSTNSGNKWMQVDNYRSRPKRKPASGIRERLGLQNVVHRLGDLNAVLVGEPDVRKAIEGTHEDYHVHIDHDLGRRTANGQLFEFSHWRSALSCLRTAEDRLIPERPHENQRAE